LWTVAAIALVFAFSLQEVLALSRLSATSDEPIHLASGYSYWRTRDFRLNPEHPPLAKLIAALPLLLLKPNIDTSSDNWKNAAQYELATSFLYGSGNDADRLLFWGRLPIVVLAALGGLVAFLWARSLFGPRAGLFAVALYSFCPNLLAHGMLVTTDVPLATFILLTLYLFWRQGDRVTWRSSLVIGLAIGAAMASKFSGGLLPLLIAAFSGVRAFRQPDRRQALVTEVKSLTVMAAASLFVIEAAYLFSASPLLYFRNLGLVYANHDPTYQYYLLGELKKGGWSYYFAVAFALKATVATLVLISLAMVQSISGLIERRGETLLLAGAGIYFLVMSATAGNLGLRYVLPIFPLVYVWVSRIVPAYWASRLGRAALVTFVCWQMWAGVSTFPNYIPYFNELAGGPSRGPDFLDDSNVDWGQSVKQAATYAKERGIQNIVMSPFSPLDNPAYYHMTANVLPPRELVLKSLPSGTYIISSHNIAWMKAVDPAWRRHEPVDRVGGLWVYRF